jgi:hypothetical protein
MIPVEDSGGTKGKRMEDRSGTNLEQGFAPE